MPGATPIALVAAVYVFLGGMAHAATFENPGFEIDFGLREHANMWGARGEAFGEAYQVYAGAKPHPDKAAEGRRVLLINLLPNSWNGIWQELPWAANAPFAWSARVLVQGGDLPVEACTFMKVEFFDAAANQISTMEGEPQRADTRGQWKTVSLKGVTPPNTASLRFVLIAGDASNGKLYSNRIYWDDVRVQQAKP